MNEVLLNAVLGNATSGVVIAMVLFGLYYSLDIYTSIAKKDFGNINIYLVYFTRNDNKEGMTEHQKSSDALHFRVLSYRLALMNIYRNRFLFWRVWWASMRQNKKSPVLNFGTWTKPLLAPIRGHVAEMFADSELRRVAGMPFKQYKAWIVMTRDRSEDSANDILKVLVIRDQDLTAFKKYIANPPKTAVSENFELLKKVAQAYKDTPEAFLPIQIVEA